MTIFIILIFLINFNCHFFAIDFVITNTKMSVHVWGQGEEKGPVMGDLGCRE